MSNISNQLNILNIGKSRRKLAIELGVKESTLRNYESGTTKQNAQIIDMICRKKNISREWLLTGEGEMNVSISQDHSGETSLELEELKNQVKMLKKEIVLLNESLKAKGESLKAKDESLKAKDESLKAKDESLGLYRQMLEQAQKALSTDEKGAIPPIDVLAFAPSAPLTERDNK